MTISLLGMLFITAIFGGSMYFMLSGMRKWKERVFLSMVFGLLFVTPIGEAVEKWGDMNKYHFEYETKRIAIAKDDEEKFSRIITEDKGVHLYFFEGKEEEYIFVNKSNIREIKKVGEKTPSYVGVYSRYNPAEHPYLVPFIRNDEYYVYYREDNADE